MSSVCLFPAAILISLKERGIYLTLYLDPSFSHFPSPHGPGTGLILPSSPNPNTPISKEPHSLLGTLFCPPLHSTHTIWDHCEHQLQVLAGWGLNLTKRRNKAVTACLHSLSPDQPFGVTSPLVNFMKLHGRFFQEERMFTNFGYNFRGPWSGSVRVTLICSCSKSYRLSTNLGGFLPHLRSQPGALTPQASQAAQT